MLERLPGASLGRDVSSVNTRPASGAEFRARGGVTAERPRCHSEHCITLAAAPATKGPAFLLLGLFIVAQARFAVANGVPGIVPGRAAVGGFRGSRERGDAGGALELGRSPCLQGTLVSVCMSRDFACR